MGLCVVRCIGLPAHWSSRPACLVQPGVLPGQCWAFPGDQGYVVIKVRGAGLVTPPCNVGVPNSPHSPIACSQYQPD